MSDHDLIRQTLALYCQYCDDGRFDEFGELFAEDAVFEAMGVAANGRIEIRAFMEAAQPPERRGRHMCTNPVIEVDGDKATVASDFVFFAKDADGAWAATAVGRYNDELTRIGDNWLFSQRSITLL